jgi:hypothetical protein
VAVLSIFRGKLFSGLEARKVREFRLIAPQLILAVQKNSFLTLKDKLKKGISAN